MDAAKVKSAAVVQDMRSSKRTEEANLERAREARQRESAPVKNPYQAPKETTNAQGQRIGTRLNEAA